MYEEACNTGNSIYLEADDLIDIAEYYQSKGEYKKAIAAADYAISIFPGATSPLLFRSRMSLIYEKNSQKANEWADKIEDKTDLDYYYLKAEILIADNHEKLADKYLEEIFENISQDEHDEFCLDIANLYIDYNLYKYAKKWMNCANKKNYTLYQEIDAQIASSEGNYVKSKKIYNKILDKDPYNNIYWNKLATVQYLSNEIDDSIASCEYAIAIDPNDFEAYFNKANALFYLHKYEEALKNYKKVAELNPNDETGEMFQGITLSSMSKFEESISHLEKAEKLLDKSSPNRIEILKQLAYNYDQVGNTELSYKYIKKALNIDPTNPDLLVLEGHMDLENGKVDEAKSVFEKAINMSINSEEVMLHIALSFYDNGYTNASYKLLNTLVHIHQSHESTPSYVWKEIWIYLALCALTLHDHDRIPDFLVKAVENDSEKSKTILGPFFPEKLEPEDYLEYYKSHITQY